MQCHTRYCSHVACLSCCGPCAAYNDNEFFGDLPVALRGKVARYRIRPCIANSGLGQVRLSHTLPRVSRLRPQASAAGCWRRHGKPLSKGSRCGSLAAHWHNPSVVHACKSVYEHCDFWPSVQALGSRAWLVLSSCMQPVALQPGHDLCQQGAPADRLWFLTEGLDTVVTNPSSRTGMHQAALPCQGCKCNALMGARHCDT